MPEKGIKDYLMKIDKITTNKRKFLDILLIGDEDEKMIGRYLDASDLFVLYDEDRPAAVCAVMKTAEDIIEIKNLATYPEYRRKGYASALIDFVCNEYKGRFKTLLLGTGENIKTLCFYKKRGFVETFRVKNFFIDNYSHPIIEEGKLLTDMIYLQKSL